MGCKYGHVCMLQPPGPHWVPAECAVSDCDKAEEERESPYLDNCPHCQRLLAEKRKAERVESLRKHAVDYLRFEDSRLQLLANFCSDEDGHVTVTCYCPRCEAERRLDQHVESLVGGYVESSDGAGEVCGRMDRSRVARSEAERGAPEALDLSQMPPEVQEEYWRLDARLTELLQAARAREEGRQ